MKKIITRIIIALIAINILLLGVTFAPLLYAENYFKNNYSVGAVPNIQSQVFQSKFDLFNPKYTVLLQLDPQNGKQGGYIVPLKRSWLVWWEVDKENIVQINSNGITFDELVKTAKDNDLTKTNPKPDNISTDGQPKDGYKSTANLTNEELYFSPPENRLGKQRNIDDFKKLKIGMSNIETKKIVGISDRSLVNYNNMKGTASHYAISQNGVNFIEILFDLPPAVYPDKAVVKHVKVIYTDRRIEDLPLQP